MTTLTLGRHDETTHPFFRRSKSTAAQWCLDDTVYVFAVGGVFADTVYVFAQDVDDIYVDVV